jgi:hypothetical protein
MIPLLPLLALAGGALVLATSAYAQGPPPFELSGPGVSSQRVEISPSAEQDDGTHQIEVFPAPAGGEQDRQQSGAGARHGRLWTIPGSTSFVVFPGTGGEFGSTPLPDDTGTRSFLVHEDPITVPSSTAPYLFAGEHYFDAQCSTATCGFLDGGLESEAESSFDLAGGSVAARVDAETPDYGRRYYDAAPGGGDIYNHFIEAIASAGIADWVYVTGPGATATLVVSATIAASIDIPPVPVTEEDWTTPVYGDIRAFDPCTDVVTTSNELLRPIGSQDDELSVSLEIAAAFEQAEDEWVASLHDGTSLDVGRVSDLHWADEEGFPDCSDDFAEVTADGDGALAPSLTLQLDVPTNEWARVSASTSVRATCLGPFACDLDVSAPAEITVTSPNGTLVAWHGIAGLTSVPEPDDAASVGAAFGAIASLARRRVV